MAQRDSRSAAFSAILNQYMAETGAKKGPDGALVYPPGVREKLESGEMQISLTPVAGERTASENKIAAISQILLALLVASLGAIIALAH